MFIGAMIAGIRQLFLRFFGRPPRRRPQPAASGRGNGLGGHDFRGLLIFWINQGYELVVVDVRPDNSTTVRASLSRTHRRFYTIAAWNHATKQKFLDQIQALHGADEVSDYTTEDILAELEVAGATVRISLDIVPVFPSGVDVRISIDHIELHTSANVNGCLDDL